MMSFLFVDSLHIVNITESHFTSNESHPKLKQRGDGPLEVRKPIPSLLIPVDKARPSVDALAVTYA